MLLFGTFAIYLSLFAGLLSILGYVQAANGNKKKLTIGRIGLNISALGIFLASVALMTDILQHNFENAYVWSYSSRDLSTALLFSTFWAGQEGSFLFWTLCSALLSVFLLSYTRKRKLEAHVLPVFLAIQTFLVVLLIAKSPFKTIFEQFPGELSPGQLPLDGRGLNPLLQNFWMVIHPPVLFIGFAAAAIPFSFAIAALWRKEYSSWLTNAFPWVLFSGLTLGAGLMLGAYWAYGVLGWGGYWGWDPVENSSLIPWIISMALLHTMLAQSRTGNLVRTNFIFAILQFVLVIYSTFLTRSGILGESSVHSFTDPGTIVYSLLMVFLAGSILLGAGFLFLRRVELKAIAKPMHFMTREFALSLGSFVLLASAAIIFFGTSLPIVSSTQVDPSFYNKMHLPIAILMALLIGYSLLVRWDIEDGKDLLVKAWKSLTASLVGTVAIAYFSMWEASYLLFIFASLFTLFVNLEQLILIIRGDIRMMGGKIAHIGMGIFLIGVIISGLFDKKETAMLELGTTQNVLGYSVTYTGKNIVEKNKTAFSVSVQKEGSNALLLPTMMETENQGMMRNPDIQSFFTHDFYISPSGIEEQKIDEHGHITLVKEETVTIGSARVTFSAFDMTGHNAKSMEGGTRIGVKLDIVSGYEKETVIPYVINNGQQQKYFGVKSKLLGGEIELLAMSIGGMGDGKSAIQIQLKKEGEVMPPMQHKEVLVVEASVKPFINLVWVGTVLVLLGFFIAILRRKLADSI
ncbi:MAG: cytochrome c biogenesis protein CcsA [Bacteroidota bacterium]|nr:cytochrome c biogenesis protein CcsA [Bacteroidota bacterium]